MATIPLLSSTAQNAEASQIIPTVNGVIQQINNNALIGSVAPTSLRNIIIGGDFSTNPWQRGTSFTGITNATTYTADRFYAIGGASSSISVSKQAMTNLPGFTQKLRFQRAASNADTTAITLNYIVASEDMVQMQGLPFVLSFWAQAGSNYSAASSVLGLTATTGTVADEGNSAYNGGTWTGKAAVTLTGSAGTTVTGVTLTTSWQRFAVAGVIPAAALELGFTWSVTPVGTAGANDFFEMTGVQLEVMPQGGVNPTPFERRPVQLERQLCQRYAQVITEPVGTNIAIAQGSAISATTGRVLLPIAVPFRVVPTTTYPLSTPNGFIAEGAGFTNLLTVTLTQGQTSTVNNVVAGCTVAAGLTVNAPMFIAGTGGGFQITMSAEL